VYTNITFDNEGLMIYTIIEVDTRDRAGLLFDLTRTLAERPCLHRLCRHRGPTANRPSMLAFLSRDLIGSEIPQRKQTPQPLKSACEAIDCGAGPAHTDAVILGATP
jgi:[protein-PII] uridylyltransferase